MLITLLICRLATFFITDKTDTLGGPFAHHLATEALLVLR
jgi:hypothetical protein